MILCHRNNKNMTFNGDYSLCESIFGKLILQRTWECVVLVSVYLQCLCPDLALLHKLLRGDRWFESPNNDFSIQSFFFGRGFLSLNLIFVSKEIFQWLSPHPFFYILWHLKDRANRRDTSILYPNATAMFKKGQSQELRKHGPPSWSHTWLAQEQAGIPSSVSNQDAYCHQAATEAEQDLHLRSPDTALRSHKQQPDLPHHTLSIYSWQINSKETRRTNIAYHRNSVSMKHSLFRGKIWS